MSENREEPQQPELVERRSATEVIAASGALAGGLGGLAAGAAKLKEAFGGKPDAEQTPAKQTGEAAQQDD